MAREDKLLHDLEDMKKLKQLNPGLFDFKLISDNPPDKYEVTFHVTGLRLDGGRLPPLRTVNHRFEIILDAGYPAGSPKTQWLTPIFHPNILGAQVCHSHQWGAMLGLKGWISMLFDWVRGVSFRESSPLDSTAAKWYAEHPQSFPVDKRKLVLPG
jgi:ubiquitin-protein ligase